MQEWNIATKAYESAEAHNKELHQQQQELSRRILQSDADLAEAATHEAAMRKDYDKANAQYPGGCAKLLLRPCQNPLTYDAEGVQGHPSY